MKITPLDIQHQQFSVRLRGFDVREVDAFLEQVADAYEALCQENEELKHRMAKNVQENRAIKAREDTFKKAILNSQRVLDQMKENAEQAARNTLEEAQVKADQIIQRAQRRLEKMYMDIAELKRRRTQLEAQIGSVLDAHSRLLDVSRREMAEMEREDQKVALLPQAQKQA
jgi:cell division initiation protein